MPSFVVTGASRGIGLEFVKQLSADSRNIVFALVHNKKTASSVIEIQRPNLIVLEADIKDHEVLKRVADIVSSSTGGSLDVLINNGALIHSDNKTNTLDTYPSPEILEDDLVLHFRTNVVGVTHTINAFLPLLKKGTTKKVIVISTGLGDMDTVIACNYATAGPYSISKAGVNMVVAKYAVTLKKEGFIFFALSPGLVKTMVMPSKEALDARYDAIVDQVRKTVKSDYVGVVPVEVSVQKQLALIDGLTLEDSGSFLSYDGSKIYL